MFINSTNINKPDNHLLFLKLTEHKENPRHMTLEIQILDFGTCIKMDALVICLFLTQT